MAEEKNVKEPKKGAAPAKAATAVKKENAKLGFGQRIAKWFREMKSELKKVIWPTPKALTNNTLISLGMMLASAVVVWCFDKLGQSLVEVLVTLVK